MPRLFWNDEKIEELKRLVSEKENNSKIARILGTSEDAVKMKLSRMKIRKGNRGGKSKLEIENQKNNKTDLATRIRILQGEEIRTDKPYFSFPDEQIRRWLRKDGFVSFSKEVLGIALQNYQKEMLRNIMNHKRVCVVAGRARARASRLP